MVKPARHLFAYGSLMCGDIMKEASGILPACTPATLKGFRRRAVKGERYPAIVPEGEGLVEGVLYHDLPDAAWKRLDRFEGEMYARQKVAVELQRGATLAAQTYVARSSFLDRIEPADWDFESFLRDGKAIFQGRYKGFRDLRDPHGGGVLQRCAWAEKSALERSYHDTEWGVAVHDDGRLFEFLILEGSQAGLSWSTILRKREAYREAFDGFDVRKVSRYSEKEVSRLLADAGIVRNRAKIGAAISNAKAFLQVQEQFGSFDGYLWQFVNGTTIRNAWEKMADIPPYTPESDKLSQDLRKRGFKFAGTTICYAFMQAVGMVNDHVVDCFRYKEIP